MQGNHKRDKREKMPDRNDQIAADEPASMYSHIIPDHLHISQPLAADIIPGPRNNPLLPELPLPILDIRPVIA